MNPYHVTINLLQMALDALWWAIALRLTNRILWRVLISFFMGGQMLCASLNLANLIGLKVSDLSDYLPQPVLATFYIWHYLALPALLMLGVVYSCAWITKRNLSRPTSRAPAPETALAEAAVTRRKFLGACAALAPSVFTFSVAGVAMKQLDHFRLRRFDLAIPSLPKQLDGLTIAHVSDVHVGEWTHGKVLRDMVDATNALRPDVVVLTGDLINYEISDLPLAISLVNKMRGRYGLWMVEGNHDLVSDGPEFRRQVKAAGIKLLVNESDVGIVRGYPVQVFGLHWIEAFDAVRDRDDDFHLRAMLARRQPDAFPLFLAHHPHAFDAAVKQGLPLTLTGHTHGGQLMLANNLGVGPSLFRYWSGHYQRENSHLIVSNGVGNMFPIRINAPAEIAHITLHCAAA